MNNIIKTVIFVFVLIGLTIGHNFTVNLATGFSSPTITEAEGGSFGNLEVLGFSHSVSVSVMRPYLFGLVKLPVYANGINLIKIHQFFLLLSLIAAVLFVHALSYKEKNAQEVENNGKEEISMESVGYTSINDCSVIGQQ